MGKKQLILQTEPKIAKGFVSEGRKFGELYLYSCSVNGIRCAVAVPLRTHHGTEIIEIIADVNLRKKLGLNFGSSITIEIER